jgi:hypothetical protein
MSNIFKSIFNLLSTSSDVTDIVDDRIFPNTAAKFDIKPYIIYTKIYTEPTDSKTGASLMDVELYQIDIYAATTAVCDNLGRLCRNRLDRFTGYNASNVIDKIIFDEEDGVIFDYDAECYRLRQQYKIRWRREMTMYVFDCGQFKANLNANERACLTISLIDGGTITPNSELGILNTIS